jgi:hypothetical protein
MLDELEELYLARHPDWERKVKDGTLRPFIVDLAVSELYAVEIGQYGSFEEALKKNV